MTLEDFEQFIETQHKFFLKKKKLTKREHVFARTVKLGEEFGELCDEVLEYMHDQRRDKSARHRDGELEEEFTDVMITLFLLAKAMNVDIMQVMDKRVKRIRAKHNKQL